MRRSLALAVIVPVAAAQRSGELEPLLFELSVLAFVVARWSQSRTTAIALGLLTVATPVAVAVVQDRAEIAGLARVYPAAGGSVALGSAKAQIGDAGCAATMAGLIHATMAMSWSGADRPMKLRP